jgi:hypothetical protein
MERVKAAPGMGVPAMKKNMRTEYRATIGFGITLLLLAMSVTAVHAAPSSKDSTPIPPFPGTLVNARYVYVTSYDGDQFDPNLLPDDRTAIGAVQDAIQKWGKFSIVYKPHDADIILMVTSRPTEDILAVYDARGWRREANYLWRMTGRNGLQASETPLVTNLKKAFEALPQSDATQERK